MTKALRLLLWQLNIQIKQIAMHFYITKDHQKSLLETLRDPKEAAAYLNTALEEGDNELFLLALKNVDKASGITNIKFNRP